MKHDNKKYTELIQWHNAVEYFDYNMAVDWAIELIQAGKETENILILASFSKPVDSSEIRPYISGFLQDLNIEEKYDSYSVVGNTHYHLQMILENYEVRTNLKKIHNLAYNNNYDGLSIFYKIYHEWWALEENEFNIYFQKATLENIEDILKTEARAWITKHIF